MSPLALLVLSFAFMAIFLLAFHVAHLLTRPRPDTRPTTPPKSREVDPLSPESLYIDEQCACGAFSKRGWTYDYCWNCGRDTSLIVDVTETPAVDEREAS